MELSREEKEHYSRHLLLDDVGMGGQLSLKQAKVLVIGAGGLGCPVLQYLTAAGVGTIGIVDFDVVDRSNLQRQILYTIDDVGLNKAKRAAERLAGLNPFVNFEVHEFAIDKTNALALFAQYDVIVDGSDNFSTRYVVSDAAVLAIKPLVYGAIHKFEGQVSVFNYKEGPTYRCLFPEPPSEGEMPSCSEVGVIGVLPGVIGTQQANEVIKILLDQGSVLSGKLLIYNSKEASYMTLKVSKTGVVVTEETMRTTDYSFNCEVDVVDVQLVDFKGMLNNERYQLIDVRESWETPRVVASNVVQIPMNEVMEKTDEIDRTKEVVVFCQKGGRSRRVIDQLKATKQIEGLRNLDNGVQYY